MYNTPLLDNSARIIAGVECLSDYGLSLLDVNGFILTWNSGSRKITGYCAEEVVGKHLEVLYSHKDRECKTAEYQLSYASKHGCFKEENWRYKKDGSKFWASVIIAAILDSSSAHIGYLEVTRDLTDRRIADRELYTLQKGIESIQDYAVILLDPKGNVLKWNKGAERIKGYTSEEILGHHFSIFYPPEVVATNFPNYELAIVRKEGRFEDEGWRMRKDGTRFWASVVITAIMEDQELIGYIKVTRDLTERKISEVKAETIKRAEQEQRARAQAGEVYQKNQTEFMDRVCHEIRNPLHGMHGNLNILRDCLAELKTKSQLDQLEDLVKEMEDSLQAIRECVQHQQEVTDEVLLASKLDSAKIIPQPKSFNPIELAQSVLRMYHGTLEEKNVKAVLDAPEKDYYCFLDPYFYKQILINLVSNAVKYTDRGSVTLRVKYREPALEIIVEDTGRGLSEREKLTLFERFSSGGERCDQYKPSRLGLFICKKTVEALGGTIECFSQIGVGTTFIVRLPCYKSKTDEHPQLQVQKVNDNFEGLRVLIVEDNKVNQKILNRMLQEMKCKCQLASHGKEALDHTDTEEFDLVLMDIEMPYVGGLEATKIIRKQGKRVPIIGLSGFAQDKDRKLAIDAGMNDYLTKPFSKEDLCRVMAKEVLQNKK